MRYLKLILTVNTIVVVVLLLSASGGHTPVAAQATPGATPFTPSCALAAPMTPEPTAAATSPAKSAATPFATQMADAPLRFTEFLIGDIKFNPDVNNPFAIVMVFTLVFANQEKSSLEVQHPQFQLSIEGVPWGDLASTDFQMGRLQSGSSMGIVLQNLTILSKTTEAQKAVLECLKTSRPVDVGLTGTLEAYPGGNRQIVSVSLLLKQVVLRSRHP